MVRCDICKTPEFVDRLTKMCEKDPHTYSEMRRVAEYFEKHREISPLSGNAVLPLMREKDPEIEAKAIETIGKQITHGTTATAKQVKQILQNLSDRKSTRGGDHKGAKPPAPVRVPHVVFPPDGDENNTGEIGDPDILDEEKDYYTGDAPETPDAQEEVETQKADVAVPPDVADIEARMEEERVAQAAKDLQKQKEDERRKEKDEMEFAALKEKDEKVQLLDALVSNLVSAFRDATAKGLPNDMVSDAINLALTAAFPGVQKPGETDDLATSGRRFK